MGIEPTMHACTCMHTHTPTRRTHPYHSPLLRSLKKREKKKQKRCAQKDSKQTDKKAEAGVQVKKKPKIHVHQNRQKTDRITHCKATLELGDRLYPGNGQKRTQLTQKNLPIAFPNPGKLRKKVKKETKKLVMDGFKPTVHAGACMHACA